MYWNNKSFLDISSILLPKLFSLKIFKLSGSYNNDDILLFILETGFDLGNSKESLPLFDFIFLL